MSVNVVGRFNKKKKINDKNRSPSVLTLSEYGIKYSSFSKRSNSLSSIVSPEYLLPDNESWDEIRDTLIGVFRNTSPNIGQSLTNIRKLSHSVIGKEIAERYKTQILQPSIEAIIEPLQNLTGQDLADELEYVWEDFYRRIRADVVLILQVIPTGEQGIEEMTMVELKIALLKNTKIEEMLQKKQCQITSTLRQMLIVLQTCRCCDPPNEYDLSFERIVALVVRPLFGNLGVYNGESIPFLPIVQIKKKSENSFLPLSNGLKFVEDSFDALFSLPE